MAPWRLVRLAPSTPAAHAAHAPLHVFSSSFAMRFSHQFCGWTTAMAPDARPSTWLARPPGGPDAPIDWSFDDTVSQAPASFTGVDPCNETSPDVAADVRHR